MEQNFDRYLEVKAALDAGHFARHQIPGGVAWFDIDEAAYLKAQASKPKTKVNTAAEE